MKAATTIALLAYTLALTSVAFASVDPVIGTTAILGKGADGAVCAATRDKLKAAYRAAAIQDRDGLREALQGGAQLARGERVLVIDKASRAADPMQAAWSDVMSGRSLDPNRLGFFKTGIDVRIRILSGSDAHLACWAWQNSLHL